MDLNNYEDLLEKAYEKIPENVKKSSRFETPKAELRIESRNTFITNFNKIISTLNRDRRHFLGIFLKSAGTMGEVRGQQLFLKGQYKEQVYSVIKLHSTKGNGINFEKLRKEIKIPDIELRSYINDLILESRIYESDKDIFESY